MARPRESDSCDAVLRETPRGESGRWHHPSSKVQDTPRSAFVLTPAVIYLFKIPLNPTDVKSFYKYVYVCVYPSARKLNPVAAENTNGRAWPPSWKRFMGRRPETPEAESGCWQPSSIQDPINIHRDPLLFLHQQPFRSLGPANAMSLLAACVQTRVYLSARKAYFPREARYLRYEPNHMAVQHARESRCLGWAMFGVGINIRKSRGIKSIDVSQTTLHLDTGEREKRTSILE